jgi:hypothetical protein
MTTLKISWVYCTLCERAFLSDSKKYCHYDWCDGHLGDIWAWETIRDLNPSYPKIPEAGTEYPLFADRATENPRRRGHDWSPAGTS